MGSGWGAERLAAQASFLVGGDGSMANAAADGLAGSPSLTVGGSDGPSEAFTSVGHCYQRSEAQQMSLSDMLPAHRRAWGQLLCFASGRKGFRLGKRK